MFRHADLFCVCCSCLYTDVVGQKATALARMFGFEVPPSTKVLIGEATVIGREEPMSFEKLCPVLGEYHLPSGCCTAAALSGPWHWSLLTL